MLANFDGDYESAAKAYSGLEAEITTPDGRTVTLYVADAFDDTWVRTPASLDIIHGSFKSLYGSYTNNKNNVVKNASWRFTGRRNERLTFKSTDSLGGWATPELPTSALTPTGTVPTTVQTSGTDTAPTPSSSANALTQAGISGFLGNNTSTSSTHNFLSPAAYLIDTCRCHPLVVRHQQRTRLDERQFGQ